MSAPQRPKCDRTAREDRFLALSELERAGTGTCGLHRTRRPLDAARPRPPAAGQPTCRTGDPGAAHFGPAVLRRALSRKGWRRRPGQTRVPAQMRAARPSQAGRLPLTPRNSCGSHLVMLAAWRRRCGELLILLPSARDAARSRAVEDPGRRPAGHRPIGSRNTSAIASA